MGLQSAEGRDAADGRPRRPAASSAARTARALEVAEHNARMAAARCRELRAAAAGPPPRGPLESWQQLLLLIIGGGLILGVVCLWLLATMYLGYLVLFALPLIAGLATLLVVRLQRSQPSLRRPTVEDMVRAVREMHEAEADVRRAQARHDAADTDPVPLGRPAPSRPR
jgi:hypothetical protein